MQCFIAIHYKGTQSILDRNSLNNSWKKKRLNNPTKKYRRKEFVDHTKKIEKSKIRLNYILRQTREAQSIQRSKMGVMYQIEE